MVNEISLTFTFTSDFYINQMKTSFIINGIVYIVIGMLPMYKQHVGGNGMRGCSVMVSVHTGCTKYKFSKVKFQVVMCLMSDWC